MEVNGCQLKVKCIVLPREKQRTSDCVKILRKGESSYALIVVTISFDKKISQKVYFLKKQTLQTRIKGYSKNADETFVEFFVPGLELAHGKSIFHNSEWELIDRYHVVRAYRVDFNNFFSNLTPNTTLTFT